MLAPFPKAYTGVFAGLFVFFGAAASGLWGGYSVSHNTGAQGPMSSPAATGFDPTGFGSTDPGTTGLAAASGHNGTLQTVALAVTAVAAAFLVIAVVSAMRRMPIRAGRPAAEEVWRRGWYCGRCATVYFLAGEAPLGIEPETAMSTAEFQHAVWAAGGYSDRFRGGLA
jgi:hypothetical protein